MMAIPIPIGSMGLVYLPTFGLDFYGKLVGKYIIIPYIYGSYMILWFLHFFEDLFPIENADFPVSHVRFQVRNWGGCGSL